MTHVCISSHILEYIYFEIRSLFSNPLIYIKLILPFTRHFYTECYAGSNRYTTLLRNTLYDTCPLLNLPLPPSPLLSCLCCLCHLLFECVSCKLGNSRSHGNSFLKIINDVINMYIFSRASTMGRATQSNIAKISSFIQ